MDGMSMMLKSLGVDPEKIKASLMDAKESIEAQLKLLHEKLDRIERKLDALPETITVGSNSVSESVFRNMINDALQPVFRNGEDSPAWDEGMLAKDKEANGSVNSRTS